MANGYNPYEIASTQENLIGGLLSAQQAGYTGDLATKKQKGEMTEEFQK